MSNILDGFTGKVPDGVSIEANVAEALEATKNMSAYEKTLWLKSKVQTGETLAQKGPWDYKNTISKDGEVTKFQTLFHLSLSHHFIL